VRRVKMFTGGQRGTIWGRNMGMEKGRKIEQSKKRKYMKWILGLDRRTQTT